MASFILPSWNQSLLTLKPSLRSPAGKLIWLFGAVIFLSMSNDLMAQAFNINVQQPTVRSFGINTVVSVPDGGTMSLGGINRSAQGQTSYGVPLLGSTPGVGRLFRNQAIGGFQTASQASVRVQIISLREMEEDLLASQPSKIDVNGNADVQRRAAFINRNIGRR